MGDMQDGRSIASPRSAGECGVSRGYWEAANNVKALSIRELEKAAIRNAKPWERDPHYFKEVKISELALLKMMIHARRGGNIKATGLVRGYIIPDTLIVMDSIVLPDEETEGETEEDAYQNMSELAGDPVIGGYHSHPGHGCWLSGIDVTTQALHQQSKEPYVAIVVDPLRTAAAGKVEIGAFRVYPKGYKPPDEQSDEYQSIPLNKIEDFGVHCKRYYSLDVTVFKSSLDNQAFNVLWDRYWMELHGDLSLHGNTGFCNDCFVDISHKLKQVESWQGSRADGSRSSVPGTDDYTPPVPPSIASLPKKSNLEEKEETSGPVFRAPPPPTSQPPPPESDNHTRPADGL